MPRLFTAIEIPEPQRLELASLKVPLPGAKWVEPDDMHITLRFAGDIGNREADEFLGALSQIYVPAFELTIAGLGAFGGNDPRTIWAGAAGGTGLETLYRANDRAARNSGLSPENRTYKPHVTLARLKYGRPDAVAKFLSKHALLRLKPFLVDRFALYSSKPNTGGGPYVLEEEFYLAPPRPVVRTDLTGL